jgi:pimeloyl-ACP methyl ester carboxylesterase
MKAFACIYFPQAGDDVLRWFTDLQERNASPDTAARIRGTCDDIDVIDLLPSIHAPTLVTHSHDDQVVPIEQGRLIASRLPNASLVALDSSHHMILDDEPAGSRLAATIGEFLGSAPA